MTDDWTKDFDERLENDGFHSGFDPDWGKVKAYVAEQRERARRDAVEYIKTHSKRLHMVGGYEVSDEVLEAAHAKE